MLYRNIYLKILAVLLITAACGPSQEVNRISADERTDLSGKWNDTDARVVANDMIADVTSKPWVERFQRQHDDRPTVIVGNVKNESMEHIDTEVFTQKLEQAFINSGEVRVVASSEEREQLREERKQQQSYSSYESTKSLAKELGADFMLIGNINSIYDESLDEKEVAVFYQVNLELVNVETNEKVWINNKEIKKFIERKRFKG